MKKFACILAAFCLIFSSASALSTADAVSSIDTMPRYAYISMIGSNLSINSVGNASCTANVELYPGYKADVTMTLLKQSGESSWTSVKSWTGYASGVLGVDLNESYWVSRGSYIVKVVVAVKNSSGKTIETQTEYSTIEDY